MGAPRDRVSIPNGIEFYLDGANFVNKPDKGFNSQRDRILLKLSCVIIHKKDVSIPNGIEFYLLRSVKNGKLLKSFNSQRDRILPLDKNSADSNSAFQFPTG